MESLVIEKICDDIFAFEFDKAKEFGVTVVKGDYQEMGNLILYDRTKGRLYVNKSFEEFHCIKLALQILNKTPTDVITTDYMELEQTMPLIKEFKDVYIYSDVKVQALALTKLLMEIELDRRTIGEKKIKSILYYFRDIKKM